MIQLQTKNHVWKILTTEGHLLVQKEYKQDGEQFWETELTLKIEEGNTHELYGYLSEYIDHEDFALGLTKDIWEYGKERV